MYFVWVFSKMKEFALKGSKFFTFRVDPFTEGRHNNSDRFASPENKKQKHVCHGEIRQLVCVGVLRLSQSNGVILSVVSLPNHMFTGQA